MGRGTRIGKQRKRVEVAKALVAGELPSQIAPKLGCSAAYVGELAAEPETKNLAQRFLSPHHARLAKATEQAVSQVERQLESDAKQRAERIAWLRDRIEKLQRVIAERGFFEAAVEELAKKPAAEGTRLPAVCPGGATGLLARSQKTLGSGPMAQIVDEFELDAALLKELREHERQLRDELNDFAPAMKGVERLCDLLELAQGGKRESGAAPAGGFTLITVAQLLQLTSPEAGRQ